MNGVVAVGQEQGKKAKQSLGKVEAVMGSGFIKRSATPMIEMNDFPKPPYPGSLPQTATVGSAKSL